MEEAAESRLQFAAQVSRTGSGLAQAAAGSNGVSAAGAAGAYGGDDDLEVEQSADQLGGTGAQEGAAGGALQRRGGSGPGEDAARDAAGERRVGLLAVEAGTGDVLYSVCRWAMT